MPTKKELRQLIASKKKQYTESVLKDLSEKILSRLEKHPDFQAAKVLLLFHSLKDEVYTHDFIEKWYKDKQILLPVVKGDELELRRYEGIQSLREGAFHILEPNGK